MAFASVPFDWPDIFLPVLYFAVKKWQWRKIHHVSLLDSNPSATPSLTASATD